MINKNKVSCKKIILKNDNVFDDIILSICDLLVDIFIILSFLFIFSIFFFIFVHK